MRIYAKKFLAILGSVIIALVAVFAAACNNVETPPEPAVYTVTAEFDETKGTVTLSKASATEGEQVTASVVAKAGFEVDAVTVNSTAVTLTEGKYTFAVTQDTVVKATFKAESNNNGTISVAVALSNYAKERGSVTLSEPMDEVYRAGEEITVTVTPNAGYDVGSVTVNGASVKLTEGKYTFEAQEDITVKATFHLAASELPAVSGLPSDSSAFGMLFRSTWISIDGETPVYIGTNKLCVGDNAIASVTPSGEGGEQMYQFTMNGKTYSLSWLNSSYTQGYVLHLLNYTDNSSAFFVKDPLPAAILNEHFEGNWIVEHGKTKLVIENNHINYDGKDAEAIVDLGYYETAKDGFGSPLASNLYYFFVEGRPYLLGWYPEGSNPTVDARSFIADIERVYNFAKMFQGTWVSLDEETTIVIGETTLTINGTPHTVDGYNEFMFVVEWNGLEYDVRIHLDSDYVLQLMHYTYGEDGLISGSEYVYFVSTKMPATVVDSALYGEWVFSEGNNVNGSILSADPITIDENGIFWGSDRAVIISEESRTDGYYYVIAVRDMICTLSYLDQWVGYEEADIPEGSTQWIFALETTNGHYEFVKNA